MKLNFYLKKHRISRNLTQKQFAERIGITQTTYSFIESGSHKPSFNIINKLSSVLEITPEEIRSMLWSIQTD